MWPPSETWKASREAEKHSDFRNSTSPRGLSATVSEARPSVLAPPPSTSRSASMSRSLFITFLLLAVVRGSASAQATFGDVELLGQVYGTRPPASFFELKARQPDAFEL